MTTFENLILNDDTAHPTDLSLKSIFASKSTEKLRVSPVSPILVSGPYVSKQRRLSYNGEVNQHWRSRVIPDQRPMSSPNSTGFEDRFSCEIPSVEDRASARLYALDNLLSRHRGASPPVFDSFYLRNSPLNEVESDDSDASSPVSQSLLAVAKSLTQTHQGVFKERSYHHQYEPNLVGNKRAVAKNVGSNAIKSCKRKGGWKFHDLSEEGHGLGKRKRAYGQHKLENEILQLYQDRVTIKEVPGTSSNKPSERTVVIEPTSICDPDLIKYNTSLRIILDKQNGCYMFQVLPHTIEKGPLTNKNQVLAAVSKMLGESGAVLCPGISSTYGSSSSQSSPENSHFNQPEPAQGASKKIDNGQLVTAAAEQSTNSKTYTGRWTLFTGTPQESNSASKLLKSVSDPQKSSTDTLLNRINDELSKTNIKAIKMPENPQNHTRCLLWHIPIIGGKGRRMTWPKETKWCINCLRKFQYAENQ